MDAVRAEIISTGNEVISGRITDTNATYLSRELLDMGLLPAYRSTVGDNAERYMEVLRAALSRAQVVIVTGGLGPTEDDLTREVCSRVLGRKLVKNEAALEHLCRILERYGIRCEEAEMRQAFIPEGAQPIPNTNGTAYGFYGKSGETLLAALSGVPSELEQMAREYLFPVIRESFPGLERHASRMLRIIGISESGLQKVIMPVFGKYPEIEWGITASQMVLTVSMSVRPSGESDLDCAQEEIIEALQEKVFSSNGNALEETVAGMLSEKGLTLAVAESCTGGLVSHLLTEVPGVSSSLLESCVTYSNESKIRRLGVSEKTLEEFGAVSEQTASEMARGIRDVSGADIGVATTGIAGPSGATESKPVGLVYVSVATKEGAWTREFRFTGNRSDIKRRAANTALNMTRLAVIRQSDTQTSMD